MISIIILAQPSQYIFNKITREILYDFTLIMVPFWRNRQLIPDIEDSSDLSGLIFLTRITSWSKFASRIDLLIIML